MRFLFLLCVFLTVAAVTLAQVITPYWGVEVTNQPLTGIQTFTGFDDYTKCKWCELDCMSAGIFSSCEYRYLHYGCHINSYCVSLAVTVDVEYHAAFGLCMMYNKCKLNNLNNLLPQDYYFGKAPSIERATRLQAATLKKQQDCAGATKTVCTSRMSAGKGSKLVTTCTSTTTPACSTATAQLAAIEDEIRNVDAKYLAGTDGANSAAGQSFAYLQKRNILYKDLKAKPAFYILFKVIQDAKGLMQSGYDDSDIIRHLNDRIGGIPEFWRIRFQLSEMSQDYLNGLRSQMRLRSGNTRLDEIFDFIKQSLENPWLTVSDRVSKLKDEWISAITDRSESLNTLLFLPQTDSKCQDLSTTPTTFFFYNVNDGLTLNQVIRHEAGYDDPTSRARRGWYIGPENKAVAEEWKFLLANDATFNVVKALYRCDGFSIGATNFVNFYLKARDDGGVVLERYDGTTDFEIAASFRFTTQRSCNRPTRNPESRGCVVIESVKYPNKVLVLDAPTNLFVLRRREESTGANSIFELSGPLTARYQAAYAAKCTDTNPTATAYFRSSRRPDRYFYNTGGGIGYLQFQSLSAARNRAVGAKQGYSLDYFLFNIVKGALRCDQVSLSPVYQDNMYVVPSTQRLDQDENVMKVYQFYGTEDYLKRATFRMTSKLTDRGVEVTFESVAKPGWFITESRDWYQYQLFLEQNNGQPEQVERRTFIQELQDV